MKQLSILSILLLLTLNAVGQQLVANFPFPTAPFLQNPAMTAPNYTANITLFHQQQWSNFEQHPELSFIGMEYPFVYQNMSLGGAIIHEKIGLFISNQLLINYSYKISIGLTPNDQLSIGLKGIFGQFGIDPKELIAKYEDDPLLITENDKIFSANTGTGIYYTTHIEDGYPESQFYIGLAANQLLPNDLIFTNSMGNFKQIVHFHSIIGGKLVKDVFFIEPSLSVTYAPNNLFHFHAQVTIEFMDAAWGGVGFSSANTFHIQMGGYVKKFKVDILKIGAQGSLNLGSGVSQKRGYGFSLVGNYLFQVK